MPSTKASRYAFFVGVGMLAIGVFFCPVDLWTKGYLAMAAALALSASFTLAKTLRDEHESKRLINKIEDAETERALREAAPPRF